MKSLLVLYSYHHNNTRKIADVFAQVLDAQIKMPQQVDPGELLEYELVGLGSGIYYEKHHASLLGLADRLPPATGRRVFIFSTSGIATDSRLMASASGFHKALREKLQSRGYTIVGEFNCLGLDTNSFLRLFGGLNRGRPNAGDLRRAEEFARGLKQKMQT
jgi:flavodoxin